MRTRAGFATRDISTGEIRPNRRGAPFAPHDGVQQNAKRFVYVLRSAVDPDRQFVESTSNVLMRVAAHNAGHSPQTANYRPWKLTTVLQFASESSAIRFEKYLKSSAGRAFIKLYLG